MSSIQSFLAFISQTLDWFKNMKLAIKHPSPKELCPPEIEELEAKFYRETYLDPEKVSNRQFSVTIRSGRG
jgi:hypothetical protein